MKPILSKPKISILCISQMKRALVLGASALIILALNHNTVSEVNYEQESPVCVELC